MAFHSLSHDMPLQRFSEQRLDGGGTRYSERRAPAGQLGIAEEGKEEIPIPRQRYGSLGYTEAQSSSSSAKAALAGAGECGGGDKVPMLVLPLMSESGSASENNVKLGTTNTWLSRAVSGQHRAQQQQQQHYAERSVEEGRKWCGCAAGSRDCIHSNFLKLQNPASAGSSSAAANALSGRWLMPGPLLNDKIEGREGVELLGGEIPGESIMALSAQFKTAGSAAPERGLLNLHSADAVNSNGEPVDSGGAGGDRDGGEEAEDHAALWQSARIKADIVSHPLYDQLLSAHLECLRIATPKDQHSMIDAQLEQSQHVVTKYSVLGNDNFLVGDKKELDQFMTQYVLLLCSFKEQLQYHVHVHVMEAVRACIDLQHSLLTLTGVSPGEGTGATMSDDEDDNADSDTDLYDGGLDGGQDMVGLGPLIPTESERSLMERVRQELKVDLKQGYRAKIADVREEILRKRRAGKLPGDTTSRLKAWWQSHSKWPYPTEDEKARLVQETGLQLKQINNWFINQRKRNWQSNPSSSTTLKSKRKR